MFAMVPPRFEPLWPLYLLLSLLVAFAILSSIALVKKSMPRFVRVSLLGISSLSMAMVLVCLLLPPVARIPRIHYRGHDQFYWGQRLHSEDSNERQEAVTALAAMVKSNRSPVRDLVIQALGKCKPEERKIALAALLELAKDENEDIHLRWQAEYAIGIMFFNHVVGREGSEEEREKYVKKILTLGWDAAVREIADGKGSKEGKQS